MKQSSAVHRRVACLKKKVQKLVIVYIPTNLRTIWRKRWSTNMATWTSTKMCWHIVCWKFNKWEIGDPLQTWYLYIASSCYVSTDFCMSVIYESTAHSNAHRVFCFVLLLVLLYIGVCGKAYNSFIQDILHPTKFQKHAVLLHATPSLLIALKQTKVPTGTVPF